LQSKGCIGKPVTGGLELEKSISEDCELFNADHVTIREVYKVPSASQSECPQKANRPHKGFWGSSEGQSNKHRVEVDAFS
jgi:hypothetical protein